MAIFIQYSGQFFKMMSSILGGYFGYYGTFHGLIPRDYIKIKKKQKNDHSEENSDELNNSL